MGIVVRGRHGYREKTLHDPMPVTHWIPPAEVRPSRVWKILKAGGAVLLMALAAYLWFHGPGRAVLEQEAGQAVAVEPS